MNAARQVEAEESLVSCAQEGNTEAFSALLDRCDKQAYRVALKITDHPQDAEDVLQDSLLSAYIHLGAFRGESRFSTWLIRIVAHQATSKVRRRASRREISLDNPVETGDDASVPRDLEDASDGPEVHYLKTELRRVLYRAIDSLEPTLRVVLVMRDLGTLSMKEMAAALEVSVTVTKSRLFRARQRLRERVLQHVRKPVR